MRIRLSQKGWNNVLIFACMFMILLFNYTSNMFSSNSQESSIEPLIPANTIVQSIDFSGIEIQRIGNGWRATSRISQTHLSQPGQFVELWTEQPLEQLGASPMVLDSAISIPVIVWVAGQQDGWVYEFVIDNQERSVYVHDKKRNYWFAIDYQMLFEFLPREILNA